MKCRLPVLLILSIASFSTFGADADLSERIQALVDKSAVDDAFSGAVLVAKDGKPIFEQAYGFAEKETQRGNDVNTKFNLGSLNKSFTSVAIAQLAEQGKLAFTDTIAKHLPDYPNKAVAEKVTIHHLLTHSSGIGDYMNREFMMRKAELKTPADILPLFANEPLAFEPGEKVKYSNAGYVVLGLIVEKITGQNYFDYVRQHIFAVAGMNDTDSYPADAKIENLATGYTNMSPSGPQPGPRRTNTTTLPGRGSPAGGGYSTVGDFLRFANALLAHKLLSAKFTEIVLSANNSKSPDGSSAGYGFMNKETNGVRVLGNGGGGPGINSMIRMYPQSGFTVIVLSNYDPPAAEQVAQIIEGSLPVHK